MAAHTQISVDTMKIAEIVLNGENYVKKIRNTIEFLEAEFPKIKSDSPQVQSFRQIIIKEFADINAIRKMLDTMSKGLAQYRAKLEAMEGSDEIWAQARASMQKANTSSAVKVK